MRPAGSAGAAGRPSLETLIKAKESFMTKARADSTWKQYGYAFKRFEKWANDLGLATLPCSETTAELYITYVGLSLESVSAAISAFAAINAFHEVRGHPSPVKSAATKMILEGIRRSFGKPSVQSEFLSPAQTGAFVAICLAAAPSRRAFRFLRAAWCEATCFRGAARFGDLVRVKRGDVSISDDRVDILFLERKNDKRHEGHTVSIPATGGSLCYVRLTLDYFAALSAKGFHSPASLVLPSSEASETGQKDVAASYDEMRAVKKIVLQKMGLGHMRINMHAPKVGAICAMRDAGVDWEEIRLKSGWKKNSAMPERYAKKATKKMVEVDNTLCFYFGLGSLEGGRSASHTSFLLSILYLIEWKGGASPPPFYSIRS